MQCRFCKTELEHVFIDLVNSPASNSFLTQEELNEPETFFPLKVYTCHHCFLVQVDEYKKSDAIFDSNYVYFSSYSKSWLAHAKAYTDMMTERFRYDENSLVIELASNDGYLLQYFKEKNIPVMGIEPTAKRVLVVKSMQHFHAAYAPIASEIVYVAAPGVVAPEFHTLPYLKAPRNQWPFVENPFGLEGATRAAS